VTTAYRTALLAVIVVAIGAGVAVGVWLHAVLSS
jgi:hypothetical protein